MIQLQPRTTLTTFTCSWSYAHIQPLPTNLNSICVRKPSASTWGVDIESYSPFPAIWSNANHHPQHRWGSCNFQPFSTTRQMWWYRCSRCERFHIFRQSIMRLIIAWYVRRQQQQPVVRRTFSTRYQGADDTGEDVFKNGDDDYYNMIAVTRGLSMLATLLLLQLICDKRRSFVSGSLKDDSRKKGAHFNSSSHRGRKVHFNLQCKLLLFVLQI